MKSFDKISGMGAAILLAVTTSAFAEDSATTQPGTQEHTRAELNLQVPTADFGQYQNREERAAMNQEKNQYRYMNKHQYKGSNSDISSSMNQMKTTNRYMQGSSATGAMNRTNTASRSMNGGRR